MSERRWFNQRLPQTLVFAQYLLYFDAFWAALGTLSGSPISLITLVACVYGASGIASEQKRGYQVAVVASFLPLALRILIYVLNPSGNNGIAFILFGGEAGGIIEVMFQYALIALLLHQQSREHQKIWFS